MRKKEDNGSNIYNTGRCNTQLMQSTLPSQGVDTKKEDNLSIVFFGAVRRGLECRTELCVITERVPQSHYAERKYTTEVMSSGFCLCASSPTR